MILIKNAQVFAPKALGKKDVLLAYDKILEIADCIEPWRDDLTVIDSSVCSAPTATPRALRCCWQKPRRSTTRVSRPTV